MDLTNPNICAEPRCTSVAHCSFPGKNIMYCNAHSLLGMKDSRKTSEDINTNIYLRNLIDSIPNYSWNITENYISTYISDTIIYISIKWGVKCTKKAVNVRINPDPFKVGNTELDLPFSHRSRILREKVDEVISRILCGENSDGLETEKLFFDRTY
jgi:hypothetical protein